MTSNNGVTHSFQDATNSFEDNDGKDLHKPTETNNELIEATHEDTQETTFKCPE